MASQSQDKDINLQTDAFSSTVDAVEQTQDILTIPEPLVDPPERTKTSLSYKILRQLCAQFGISEEEVILPGESDSANSPPQGYIAINRHMCLAGAIPPFNPFLEEFLRRLRISPFQLHPNGYAILQGLCILFGRTIKRLPTFDEICYLCTFSHNKEHTSILYLRSARSRRLITDLSDSAHGFLNQYFFIRCRPGFYGIWRKAGESYILHFLSFEFS